MNAKETKDERNKAKDTEFGANFKHFGKMFEKMSKCCMGQEGLIDCCGMMDERMKEMMRKWCGPRPSDNNQHGKQQKA